MEPRRDSEPARFRFGEYLKIGGAMGWKPWDVRRATLNDFLMTFEGWKVANGVSEPGMSREEAELLRSELWGDE